MRYRTRLLWLLLGLAVVTNGLVFSLIYIQAKDSMLRQIRSTVSSIVAATAPAISAEKHETLRTRDDEKLPAYAEIISLLRKVRDANRRDGVHIQYMYTMRPSEFAGKWAFVVDGEEDLELKSHVGDVYKPTSKEDFLTLERPSVTMDFTVDEWGTWLTATQPILNAQGKPVAIVAADIRSTDVQNSLRKILWSGLASTAFSMAAAVGMSVILSRKVTRPLQEVGEAVKRIGDGDFRAEVKIMAKDEFGELGRAINGMAIGLQQRENLKGALAQYVSEEVTNRVLESEQPVEIKGERRRITVLFADIRGLNTLAEKETPEKLMGLLNTCFEAMIEAVFKHNGYLNKFKGDGIMAVFGAIKTDERQEENAVKAALAMRKAMADLHARGNFSGQKSVEIGIGVHTGVAVVGNVGSRQRMEFTAIGDTVNLASRLETATLEMPGTDILVSDITYAIVRDVFKFASRGQIKVKGRDQGLQVYAVEAEKS